MDNKQIPIQQFTPAEKAAFEKDMQEVLAKHSAILICQPFISPKGTVEAVLNVYKKQEQIPSPYVPTADGKGGEAPQGGVPAEAPKA